MRNYFAPAYSRAASWEPSQPIPPPLPFPPSSSNSVQSDPNERITRNYDIAYIHPLDPGINVELVVNYENNLSPIYRFNLQLTLINYFISLISITQYNALV